MDFEMLSLLLDVLYTSIHVWQFGKERLFFFPFLILEEWERKESINLICFSFSGIKLITLAHSQTVILISGTLLHEAVKWKFQPEN